MAPILYQGIRFKACRRCGGDGFLEQEEQPEWRCLQCGRLVGETAGVARERDAEPKAA